MKDFNPATELHRTLVKLWKNVPPLTTREAVKDILNADLTKCVDNIKFVKRKVSDFGGIGYASKLPNYFCRIQAGNTNILLTVKI